MHGLKRIKLLLIITYPPAGSLLPPPKFTFHYELIITVVPLHIKTQCRIYISLWTNYNLLTVCVAFVIFISFTFHYELIITIASDLTEKLNVMIYISLWTNYNNVWW